MMLILVLFAVAVVLYCGVGCFVNVRSGAEMTQACPQRAFWCGLPGLVKDGCVCFFGTVCRRGGDGGGYDSIGGDKTPSKKQKTERGGGSGGGGGSSSGSSAPIAQAVPVAAASPYGTGSGAEPAQARGPRNSLMGNSFSGQHEHRNDDFADTSF